MVFEYLRFFFLDVKEKLCGLKLMTQSHHHLHPAAEWQFPQCWWTKSFSRRFCFGAERFRNRSRALISCFERIHGIPDGACVQRIKVTPFWPCLQEIPSPWCFLHTGSSTWMGWGCWLCWGLLVLQDAHRDAEVIKADLPHHIVVQKVK